MTEQHSIRRNDLWMTAWVGQEMVMMSGQSGSCISLSESGGRIWELLEQPATVADLCHALEVLYQIRPEQIRVEVFDFLEQMLLENAVLLTSSNAC